MPTDYRTFTSEVNSQGLDENFPVPGVNNPTQGFRDNFARIKSAIQQTATELTELREYVLRRIDEGEIFDHDNDVQYYKLIRAQLKGYIETFFNIGESGFLINLNFENGNFQKTTLTNNADLVLINFPSAYGSVGRATLWVTVTDPAYKINLPSDIIYGTNVDYVIAGKIVFPASGNYLIEVISVNDAGQFWLVGVQGLETAGTSSASSYELPVATVNTLGGVKVDGVTIGIFNGTIKVIGGVPAPSDIKIKTDIKNLSNSLDIVCKMRGVSYTRIDTEQREVGVIAQEIQNLVPELVSEHDGMKSVYYGNMNALLIEAIKELKQQVDELRNNSQPK